MVECWRDVTCERTNDCLPISREQSRLLWMDTTKRNNLRYSTNQLFSRRGVGQHRVSEWGQVQKDSKKGGRRENIVAHLFIFLAKKSGTFLRVQMPSKAVSDVHFGVIHCRRRSWTKAYSVHITVHKQIQGRIWQQLLGTCWGWCCCSCCGCGWCCCQLDGQGWLCFVDKSAKIGWWLSEVGSSFEFPFTLSVLPFYHKACTAN